MRIFRIFIDNLSGLLELIQLYNFVDVFHKKSLFFPSHSFIDSKRPDQVLIQLLNVVILEITAMLLSEFPRT